MNKNFPFFGSDRLLIFDGAMGTELQSRVDSSFEDLGEKLNISNPELIRSVHVDYLKNGADFITTNTFSANSHRLSKADIGEKTELINERGAEIACRAVKEMVSEDSVPLVAGSMGPTGAQMTPMGGFLFDEIYDIYLQQARALVRGGANCLIIETQESLREIKAATIAARETGVPIIASMAFTPREVTNYGVSPESAAVTLSLLGVDVIGANCGTGPAQYPSISQSYQNYTAKPILIEPNAGLPQLKDGVVRYEMVAEEFVAEVTPATEYVNGIGSCCGSSPEFTSLLSQLKTDFCPPAHAEVDKSYFASANNIVETCVNKVEIDTTTEGWKEELSGASERGSLPLLDVSGFSGPPVKVERKLSRILTTLGGKYPLGFTGVDEGNLLACLKAYSGVPGIYSPGRSKSDIEKQCSRYGGVLISK